MSQYQKHFSVEEARRWLPELRRRFERIHALYTELEELRHDFERVLKLIRQNGHAPRPTPFETRLRDLHTMVNEIIREGIEIKDIQRGLVDFPHWRDGEEVFLCWELAEDDIRFWHRITDGYAGRQPL